MSPNPAVRRAVLADLPEMGALAGRLVRQHHERDPQRFFLPKDVEQGYGWWFERELANKQAVLLVAEVSGKIVGYAYARQEERDWNMLLDAHGALHDVFVLEGARRGGVGRALLTAVLAELTRLGSERVVLSTMVSNEAAQRLFASFGFRPTMLEMTCEMNRQEGAAR